MQLLPQSIFLTEIVVQRSLTTSAADSIATGIAVTTGSVIKMTVAVTYHLVGLQSWCNLNCTQRHLPYSICHVVVLCLVFVEELL